MHAHWNSNFAFLPIYKLSRRNNFHPQIAPSFPFTNKKRVIFKLQSSTTKFEPHHPHFTFLPLLNHRPPILPYATTHCQTLLPMPEISLTPCNGTGCSLIRDRRRETCSVARSNLSFDLADSVIRAETIFCNNCTLSA